MKSKVNQRARRSSKGLFDANAAIDLAHAVQDLGLGMIDAGMEPLPEISPASRKNAADAALPRKSCERFNLTASAKRALSSVLANRRHKKRVHAHLRALSSFPDVPDHPIS
ncbi:Oidioi.mRNA.OKI2018_I69.PAR.g11582.t1.cds [Oikopleura dioica]|uniref:Oidioi.mRNA.OKI2018_I69.PAR.g11582.t1.cds n=1 Tax=Oikopleura dioica TaxID=34765 RepID=A0ABN7RZE7_OIKDI|nr:Oidioi.mRNA.OKI2018_I69.PAR.g11582.t1.cds [Oikopleura dioica]